MKLANLFLEASSSIDATDNARELIEKECSSAVANFVNGDILYRGDKTLSGNIIKFVPEAGHGAQHLSTNFHYNLMKILPEWKNIPDRTKSVDMSTSYFQADAYGDPYVCFPVNGSVLAYGPGIDFWDIFPVTLDRWRTKIFKVLEQKMSSYMDVSNFMNRMSELTTPSETKKFIKDLQDVAGTEFTDWIINNVRMGANGIQTTTDIATIPDNVEVWTEGTIYMVSVPLALKWW